VARLVLLALVVALTASCGSGDERANEQAERAAARAAAAQGRLTARPAKTLEERSRAVGRRRLGRALLYVPPAGDARQLVVVLHGATESAEDAFALFRPYADQAGLILLAPKSRGTTWDLVQGGFGPDVAAIDRLLARVFAEYPVDQVALAGFSDGASYALSLGLTNGDLFQSVIAFSAGFIALGKPRGLPRLFVSHGTEDAVLPIGRTSRRGVPRLRAAGYRVHYREFTGGHEAPPRIVREAVAWLEDA
jgi:phospholipase/carboxylesterase